MADGNIVAAKTRLGRAVSKLLDPIPNGAGQWAPGLLAQLRNDLPGRLSDRGKAPGRSMPPLWIDSLQLLAEVDRSARGWWPKPGTTEDRLRALSDCPWRPQDTDFVLIVCRRVEGWSATAKVLLNPVSRKAVSAACPACGRRWVYGRDSAGEQVRMPALSIQAALGCVCQGCEAQWSPDRYMFLIRLLGFELPEGVLE